MEEFINYKSRPKWILCRKYKFAFPHIAKNALTTLFNIIYEIDMNGNTENLERNQDWYIKVSRFSRCKYEDIPEDYIKFAVYRNPIERFYSYCLNKNRTAKLAIDIIKNRIRKNGVTKDEHLRPQQDSYKDFQVDYIVKIEDLDDFLRDILKVDENLIKHYNQQHFDTNIELSDDEKVFIYEYYKNDNKILNSNKLWIKKNS